MRCLWLVLLAFLSIGSLALSACSTDQPTRSQEQEGQAGGGGSGGGGY